MVATRVVVHDIPPVLLSARVRFARRDVLPIALLGITQFGILIALLTTVSRSMASAGALLALACVAAGLWLAHRD